MKKSNKLKNILANILIVLGVLLIIIGVGYEAVNYPWNTVFGSVPTAGEMPMPSPLAVPYQSYYPTPQATLGLSSLPVDNNNLPLVRPQLDLTLMGTIKIPKIGISENIVQGADAEILYGVGHIPSSADPGKAGNCVLVGHRNYVYMHPFKHLPKVAAGDMVYVEMDDKTYSYKVTQTFEVTPDEVWVTTPQPDKAEKLLTLVTCTPVPSYTHRLIVWAELVEN